jgi:hypothetical protein
MKFLDGTAEYVLKKLKIGKAMRIYGGFSSIVNNPGWNCASNQCAELVCIRALPVITELMEAEAPSLFALGVMNKERITAEGLAQGPRCAS